MAGPSPALAVTITAIHVAAMTLWIGGLVALLTGLLQPGARASDLATALPRFSSLALGSVVALVLTGVVQGVREVGSPTALFATPYGWVLVAKVALLFVVLGAAGISRVWVQQHLGAARPRRSPRRVTAHAFAAHSGTGTDTEYEEVDEAVDARAAAQAEAAVADVRPFRRSVLLEAGLLAVVLALSAVLTGTAPARVDGRRAVRRHRAAAGRERSGRQRADLGRPRAGRAEHAARLPLRLRRAAHPAGRDPRDARGAAAADRPDRGRARPAGPGHYVAEGMDRPRRRHLDPRRHRPARRVHRRRPPAPRSRCS